ncbi:MAG: 5-(carboxyamino)imidazole ribonucleotide synthase [Nitrosopumilus sp. D6]|nr:MAG: 5-(carboxyamino)imidazole ribonucleotide synthase [Nitrosopumilus sp. D6]
MARVLGMIGGGQLGMMIAEAAKTMPEHISEVVVLDPTAKCPASQVGARQIVADFKDKDAIMQLARECDIVTYEIESGDADVLESVSNMAEINPLPETLRVIQDKLLQKTFLSEHGLPVPEFAGVDTLADIKKSLQNFGLPAMLKARRDAYDGRGNFAIESEPQAAEAFEYFNGRPLLIERHVQFKMEVSVIAARNTAGQIATYPLVENIHEKNILRQTIAPARVSDGVTKKAQRIAEETMEIFKGAGVFGIEMFVTKDDGILINEIAPRVHNSGHHTLQSSSTSQFEQHLRAILGLELGSTKLVHNAVMYNILGPDGFEGRYLPPDIHGSDVYLKMYGKEISKPARKLGHLNIVGNRSADLLQRLDGLLDDVAVHPA